MEWRWHPLRLGRSISSMVLMMPRLEGLKLVEKVLSSSLMALRYVSSYTSLSLNPNVAGEHAPKSGARASKSCPTGRHTFPRVGLAGSGLEFYEWSGRILKLTFAFRRDIEANHDRCGVLPNFFRRLVFPVRNMASIEELGEVGFGSTTGISPPQVNTSLLDALLSDSFTFVSAFWKSGTSTLSIGGSSLSVAEMSAIVR